MEIIPAILTDSPGEILLKIGQLEGLVARIQIDIIDGEFAENKALGLETLTDVETQMLIDIHLMTKDPVDWVEKCVRAQADRIIGQIEKMSDQIAFVGKVQEVGRKVGLAIDLPTEVNEIDTTILKDLDVVLVMSVKAGFQGQEFDESALEKVRELDALRAVDQTPFRICVDGGVSVENIGKIKRAGADEVVVGSHLFKDNLQENMKELEDALN